MCALPTDQPHQADENSTTDLATYKAKADEIAAQYGLKEIPPRVIEAVAIYDFISETVAPDHIQSVFETVMYQAY